MKITYLKSHNGFSEGDREEVSEERGNYLIGCKVAKLSREKKETKDDKTKLDKK